MGPTEITTDELASRSDDFVILDVREDHEVRTGRIPGSCHLPVARIAEVGELIPDPDRPVAVYCSVGIRSASAADAMRAMGYSDVRNLRGGFGRWVGEGLPSERQARLTDAQAERYARHLVLPQVGPDGQERLMGATVAIVGAGGLGSPVAMYLAAAGVGTLGIIDFDVVDASNLQRQVIHPTDRVGEPKTSSAAATVRALNPEVVAIEHPVRLEAANVLEVLDGYQVIVDATDSFPTRYLINDASLHLGTPVVHGSIFRFDGQVTVFDPWNGPCYRCLFVAPPPPEAAPNCAEAGVLGVLPGVIGSLQATEVLKSLLGIGDPLTGRLLMYDALAASTDEVRFPRDPSCPACSDPDRLPTLIDYDESCAPA